MKVTFTAQAPDCPWPQRATIEGKDWQDIAKRLYARMCRDVSLAAVTYPDSGYCPADLAHEYPDDCVTVAVVEDPPADPLIAELEALAD